MISCLPKEINNHIISFLPSKELHLMKGVSTSTLSSAEEVFFQKYLSNEEPSKENIKSFFEKKRQALKSFVLEITPCFIEEINGGCLSEKLKTIYQMRRLGEILQVQNHQVRLFREEHENALSSCIEKKIQEKESLKIKFPKNGRRGLLVPFQFPWKLIEQTIVKSKESITLSIKRMQLEDSDIPHLLRVLDTGKIAWLGMTKDRISDAGLRSLYQKIPSLKVENEKIIFFDESKCCLGIIQ